MLRCSSLLAQGALARCSDRTELVSSPRSSSSRCVRRGVDARMGSKAESVRVVQPERIKPSSSGTKWPRDLTP